MQLLVQVYWLLYAPGVSFQSEGSLTAFNLTKPRQLFDQSKRSGSRALVPLEISGLGEGPYYLKIFRTIALP